MKFCPGDHFYVLDNGVTGRIIRLIYDPTNCVNQYEVLWDHLSRVNTYPVYEGDQEWEFTDKDRRAEYMAQQRAQSFGSTDSQNNACQHNWKYYYGLFETFSFCEKCDEKKIDNNPYAV